MKKRLALLSLFIALLSGACGGGVANDTAVTNKMPVRSSEFLKDKASVDIAEKRLKTDGLFMAATHDNRVVWQKPEAVEEKTGFISNSEKILALQDFLKASRNFLKKYSTQPSVIVTSDGEIHETSLDNKGIYVYNQKIKLASAKVKELQNDKTPLDSPNVQAGL